MKAFPSSDMDLPPENYSLPRQDGRDVVAEIARKKKAARRKRCLGTNSCDCPRCNSR